MSEKTKVIVTGTSYQLRELREALEHLRLTPEDGVTLLEAPSVDLKPPEIYPILGKQEKPEVELLKAGIHKVPRRNKKRRW